jgi:predicted N-acetyltransferase YhbS
VIRPEHTVRRASLGDAEALATTIVAAFEQYRGALIPESGALRETAASIAAELDNGAAAFIGEAAGQVVACVMTKPLEGDLYFGRLSVLPTARGAGLGPLLVTAVENHARRQGAPATRLNVRVALPENQAFFAALGYVDVGREAHPGFDAPTFISMRKPLRASYWPSPR